MGSTNQDEEAILQILGAAKLCKSSSSESTEEQMISALEQLNSESGGSLKSHAHCCLVQSTTYEEFKMKCSLHAFKILLGFMDRLNASILNFELFMHIYKILKCR